MKSWIVCALVAAVIIAEVHAASLEKTTAAGFTTTKEPFGFTSTKEAPVHRQRRQLGYGNQYGNLASQLAGISSGYGYGYNNALGLGGLGAGGAGAGYLPILG